MDKKIIIVEDTDGNSYCLIDSEIQKDKDGKFINPHTQNVIIKYSIINDNTYTKINENIEYIGSNVATGEGIRHYFILKCINGPYKNMLQEDVHHLPVYTSTGKNTGKICEQELCIIPCFGTCTLLNPDPLSKNKYPIIAPILKADYIDMFKWLPAYKDIIKYYKSDIPNKILGSYFTKSYDTIEIEKYKKKVGSLFFMENILYYKSFIASSIDTMIKENKFKYYPNLLFLNKEIAKNNFTGLNLNTIDKYTNFIKSGNFRPDLYITGTQVELDILNKSIKNMLDYLRKNERDKFDNIVGSPLLSGIKFFIK